MSQPSATTGERHVQRSGGGWAASGVLSSAGGLGVAHVVAAFAAPAASPLVAVGSRAIDLTPGPVKDWAIATFGTADKVVLMAGALVVTLLLGGLVGLLARRSLASALVAGTLLATVALLAAGFDPGRRGVWWLPAPVALGVAAWLLAWLTQPLRDPARGVPGGRTAQRSDASRRTFLRRGLTAGGAGVLGWLGGQGLQSSSGPLPAATGSAPSSLPSRSVSAFPAGLEGGVQGLSPFVTPASDFYRIDTALSVPAIDAGTWRLEVKGLVDRPFSLGWADLLALDAVERPVTLACVSNEVGGGLVGSARWLGVRTRDLLARAGVQAGADMVLSTSIDGFTVSTPLAALTDGRDALVAYGMNGAALPPLHGYPARLLTPGLYGFVGATKWLASLEVTTFAARVAYWTERGWSPTGPIKPSSRIEVPRAGSRVQAGLVKVGGAAWAHGVGVGGVQVRTDGGPWQDATLGPDAGVQFWRQWVWEWDAPPGDHRLEVRVVDASGAAQSEAVVPPFPDGASGLHGVQVTVVPR